MTKQNKTKNYRDIFQSRLSAIRHLHRQLLASTQRFADEKFSNDPSALHFGMEQSQALVNAEETLTSLLSQLEEYSNNLETRWGNVAKDTILQIAKLFGNISKCAGTAVELADELRESNRLVNSQDDSAYTDKAGPRRNENLDTNTRTNSTETW